MDINTILKEACLREQILIDMGFKWHKESKYYSYQTESSMFTCGITMLDLVSLDSEKWTERLELLKRSVSEINMIQ